MNILQTEDLVKGLPDEMLMQQAKTPDGQIPQFLLVSEVQRRADMRKRFEQENSEQPEGTVSEQILQQGLGSQLPPQGSPQGPPPPQPPQGRMPPPNMPNPLPTGQGLVPSTQQFPPMQDPNAALMPPGNGMAGGGVVRMQNLGQVPRGGGNRYNRMYYPNPVEEADEYTWRHVLQKRAEEDNETYSAGGLGGFMGDLGRSTRSMSEKAFPEEVWDKQFGIVDKAIGDFKEAPLNVNQHLWNAVDFMKEPVSQLWDSAKDTAGNVGRTAREMGRGLLAETGMDVGEGPFVRSGSSSSAGQLEAMAAMNAAAAKRDAGVIEPDGSVGWLEGGGLDPIFGGINAIGDWFSGDEEAAPDEAKSPEQLQSDLLTEDAVKEIEVAEDAPESGGITDLAPPVDNGPQTQGFSGIQAQAVPEGRNSEYDQYMKNQRQMAWSNALMQLGAGIAGGDISKGLSGAGTAMMQGQKLNDVMQLQKMRQRSQDERLDRTLAQRERESQARQVSGSADIRSSQWFLDLPIASQRKIMRRYGKDMPEDEINKFVSEVMVSRQKDSFPMTEEERISLTNQLRGVYGLDVEQPGSSEDNPIDVRVASGRPASGTWIRHVDGRVVQVP